jgi:hypothetical protein
MLERTDQLQAGRIGYGPLSGIFPPNNTTIHRHLSFTQPLQAHVVRQETALPTSACTTNAFLCRLDRGREGRELDRTLLLLSPECPEFAQRRAQNPGLFARD